MKTIYLTGRDPYIIGQTGESNAVTLRVDVDEWKDAYDGGHGILTFRWPNKTVYPLDTNLVQYNDKYYLEAIVTSNETRYPGWVVVQAQWYDGETLVYSRSFSCKVLSSHGGYIPGGDTVPTWVTALIARLDAMDDTESAVETYKEGAELAAQNAADSLSAAQAAAESAGASAATATQAAETATQKADNIPADFTGLVEHIAGIFDAETAYSAGQYVWNNGDSKLYRFTKDHAAGAWTGADAEEVTIGTELLELENTVGDRTLYASSDHLDFEWLMGYGVNSTGRLGSNSKSVSTRNAQYALHLYKGSTFSANEGYVVSYAFWRVPPPSTSSSDNNNSNRIAYAQYVSAGEIITVPEDCYVLISCKYADDSAIPDGMTAVEFATVALTINLYYKTIKEKDTELQGEIDALSENIETVQDKIVLATPYTALLNSFLCPDFETVIEGRKYSKAGNSITMRWQVSNNSHTVCFFTGSAFYAQNADAVTDAVPPIETLATINSNLNKVKLAIYVASTYTGSTNSNLNIHYCKVENETVTVIDVVRLTTVRMTQYALYNEIELTIPSGATHFALSYFAAGDGPSATVTLGLKPKDEDLQSQIDTLTSNDTVLQNAVDTLSAKDTELETEIDTLTAGKLESTGDATDRTAEIRAKLTANGYCELGNGEFVVANLEMPDGTELRGQGYATVLKLDTSLTSGAAVVAKNRCTVRDLAITGADSLVINSDSTAGNRHGIKIDAYLDIDVRISNVRINRFDGYGIYVRGFGMSTSVIKYVQCNVSDCFIDHCFAGIYVGGFANNAVFTNCHCVNGYYAVYATTRCQFADCVFMNNLMGVYVVGKGPSFIGCTFHDEGSTVNTYALVAQNVTQFPMTLTGCRFYGCGALEITGTSGSSVALMALFSGCTFGGMTLPIVCNYAAGILFDGCLFGEDVTASGNISESSTGLVKLKNCYRTTTGALLER